MTREPKSLDELFASVPSKCEGGNHVGTFSFGCTPGVVRCDACGQRVTTEDVKKTAKALADTIAIELPTKGNA